MLDEKSSVKEQSSSTQVQPVSDVVWYDPDKESIWTRIGISGESFKRAPGPVYRKEDTLNGRTHDEHRHDMEREVPLLPEKLKNRHLQMIAVGGSIGTGLFIGTGGALATGGPAGVLIAWILMGFMLFNTCQAMGEMSIMYPVSGGFYNLSNRFLDKSWGFAMGWNYVLQWAVVLPLEITAAAGTVEFWRDDINPAVWITVFMLFIFVVTLFGTIAFGEEEFWSSCLKLFVVVLFIFISLVMVCGGGPSDGEYSNYVGGRYWNNPGAFANGFKGVCGVFVTAAFSFAGTEVVGIAATESANPRKRMPKAIKMTFWRITIIYIVSLIFIGLLIPYNDELLGGSGARHSPFVIVMTRAGLGGLAHLINVTILVAIMSIGVSSVYAGSRTLHALGEQGYAPKIFAYVDKAGRPLWATVFICAFAPIAYVVLSSNGGTVFDWLLALSGLSTLFTWASINLAHIRFRRAWAVQGHSVDEIPFQAALGVPGSWSGFILIVLVLIAQFYIALFPIGGSPDPEAFFKSYLAFPVVVFFYIAGFVWKRETPKRAHEIDLVTGRKVWDTAEELNEERARLRQRPLYVRLYTKFF
ncbi:hypothetical protein FRC02_009122 [Tulasnella sp. 418]|nr:hypothetical protein FRC02_009122 [Tulasnella sp. 418]